MAFCSEYTCSIDDILILPTATMVKILQSLGPVVLTQRAQLNKLDT